MNYSKFIKYDCLSAASDGVSAAVNDILEGIPVEGRCVHISFFTPSTSQEAYLQHKAVIDRCMAAHFADKTPAYTLVAQPPLHASVCAEVRCLDEDAAASIYYRSFDGHNYTVVESADFKMLFTGGLATTDAAFSVARQAECAFEMLLFILEHEAMTFADIVRQWNYIPHITQIAAHDGQHYQQFNNVRSDYYSRALWSGGYPAATGIGTSAGTVTIDAIVLKANGGALTSRAIDNRLQIAAHAYSDEVLLPSRLGVSTPKFERARAVVYGSYTHIYVSGTASIRGQLTVAVGDIEGQYRCTIDNIRQLTAGAAPVALRAYLKDKAYYPIVKAMIDHEFKNVLSTYVIADVCRDDLLIEIEAIYSNRPMPDQA